MAKSKIDKDDIKRLVENTSSPLSTTSVYSAKYVEDNFLKEITKEAIEVVLTGDITSHEHNYLEIDATAADSEKLDGINSTGFAQLENGKIKATNLPDYLLGQVLYGGSINASQACTLSSLYKDKFNTTDTTRLLANLSATPHVGVYFIASGNFLLNGTIDVNVGDWVISDGITWGKIDNTDAVASVNGQTGVVNLDYEDLGDMPVATDTEVGGIIIGFTQGLDADLLDGKHASDFADVDHVHDYDYTTPTDVQTLIDTAVASVYKLKGNIANKAALLALTNIKQGDVYNAQTAFTLNLQNVKIGDNIVCLANATNSTEANWDNLAGDENTTTIGSLINGATAKTTPVDADMFGLMDSDASNVMKKLSWANIKNSLLGFYSVKVGSTYITATSNQDTIEFVAGTNVLLTPDAGGKTVTIASSYRVIKVNNSQYISSGALSFFGIGGVQITPSFGAVVVGGQDLELEFSADPNVLISFLGDLPNSANLWASGIGVSFLKYGNTYSNTPNPVCGTDTSSTTIEGFLTHYKYSTNFHSFTFHNVRTNKMYISSSFWDGEEQIWNDWKRLLTCLDSTDVEAGEVPAVFDSGKWTIELLGDSSSATIEDFEEKDEIYIKITAYEDHAMNLGIVGIYTFTHNLQFIPSVNGPINIQFTGNGVPHIITTAPGYLDPSSINTPINLIEFTFKVFYSPSQGTVHTIVHNTIY